MAEVNARDAKLIQYLNEAYGKEKELETSLEAHIAMAAPRKPYQKRLREHLRETKRHAREVERRIKKLGGKAGAEGVAAVVHSGQTLAKKGLAAAEGAADVVSGTGEQEKLLKNARTEYSDEAEEIATYTAIETLAEAVGDKETAKLAKAIRREEERMASFLTRLIPTLTKAAATEDIPAALRRSGRRRSSGTRRRAASSSRSSSGDRKSTARKSTARKSTGRKSTARGSTARRSAASRSTARKSSGGSSAKAASRRTSSARKPASGSRSGGRKKS